MPANTNEHSDRYLAEHFNRYRYIKSSDLKTPVYCMLCSETGWLPPGEPKPNRGAIICAKCNVHAEQLKPARKSSVKSFLFHFTACLIGALTGNIIYAFILK
jgi:hypothetical protein